MAYIETAFAKTAERIAAGQAREAAENSVAAPDKERSEGVALTVQAARR